MYFVVLMFDDCVYFSFLLDVTFNQRERTIKGYVCSLPYLHLESKSNYCNVE